PERSVDFEHPGGAGAAATHEGEQAVVAVAALLRVAVHDHRRRSELVVLEGRRDMTDIIGRFTGRSREEQIAHCPTDDWDFAPRYTDGACPICGWRPEGIDTTPPLA